jgi:hypothetical protein
MTAREQLRHLVENLPEPEVFAALRFVEFLTRVEANDPMTRFLLRVAEEDEETPDEEAHALDTAGEQARRGDVVAWEDVKRRLD